MAVVPILATFCHGGGGAVRRSTGGGAVAAGLDRPTWHIKIDAIRIYRNI